MKTIVAAAIFFALCYLLATKCTSQQGEYTNTHTHAALEQTVTE